MEIAFILILFFSFLFFLWLFGFQILRKFAGINFLPFLIPGGLIFSLSFTVVAINLLAFIFPVKYALVIYLLCILVTTFKLNNFQSLRLEGISFKEILFLFLTIIFWGVLIFWKANFVLWGGDRNIYYAVASTFLEGNFPVRTPWQPDEIFSYHYGISLLLSFFSFFSGASYDFAHIFIASVIILSIPVFIFSFIRVKNFYTFLFSSLISSIAIISFGFIKIPFPKLPFAIPEIYSINELVIWLRQLPTARNTIDTLGTPVDLDGALYSLFHPFGLCIILLIIGFSRFTIPANRYKIWTLEALVLVSLGLINEVFFPPLFLLFFLNLAFCVLKNRSKKNIIFSTVILLVTILVVLFQGGVISQTLLSNKNYPQSLRIFPDPGLEGGRFINYQLGQAKTRFLSLNPEFGAFKWFSIGVEVLFILAFIIFILRKKILKDSFFLNLYLSGIFFLFLYFSILPIFETYNSNRILAVSYWCFSLLIIFLVYELVKVLKKYKIFILVILTIFLLPSIIPPLARFSITRFGESRFKINVSGYDDTQEAVKKLVKKGERITVLDKNSPHPSGVTDLIIQSGVFSPVFAEGFRTYTMEPGPEYIDIVYTLSPSSVKKLSLKYLLIDSFFYKTLPEIRRKQLDNPVFFKQLFNIQKFDKWEKIFLIQDKYFEEKELEGNILDLDALIPYNAKVYIDEYKNFSPDFLRSPVIFLLRKRSLYYVWGSGVYLHVQEPISGNSPEKSTKYDYLILSPDTNPQDICKCRVDLLWKLINGKLFLWKTNMDTPS